MDPADRPLRGFGTIRRGGGVVERPLLHVISHTDLDGIAAAALAWHVHRADRAPIRVSLTGYGEVDNLILETLETGP